MLLPAAGFIMSFLFFAVIGIGVLRWRSRKIRLSVVVAFAIAAQVSVLLFAWAYGQLFASPTGRLESTIAVLGFLIGVVVAGAVGGYLVTTRLLGANAVDDG